MKTLILLFIVGNFFSVTPPAEASPAPMVDGVFAQEPGGDVYAHSNLAGQALYKSEIGDYVVGYWLAPTGEITSEVYLVKNKVIAIGKDTHDYREAGDWLIRPWNEGPWYRLSTIWLLYHTEGGLTLSTCYPDYLPTTGRLYLQLDLIGDTMPKEKQ